MKRRANGEGSIRQRSDGRWECQVVLPDGRRKSLYARTQREVLERRKTELERVAGGMPSGSERQTVAEYLTVWLDGSKTRVRLSTWTSYRVYIEKHIVPELGRVRLAQLTPAHLQRLYAKLIAAGKAPISVRHLHALLHKALGDAAKWGLVPRNIVPLIDPPRAPRHEMTALDERQVRALLDEAAGDRLGAFYVLAVTTGMRLGEMFALRWKDVDLEKRMLQVRQTVSWAGGSLSFGEPKTKKSRRRIELSALAVAALKDHRRRQLEERLRSLGAWQEDLDLVFTNEIGGALHPSNVMNRSYRPLLERARLPRIRLHDLRHTAATIALARGVPAKIVSEMLGHSSVAVTLDIYSHVTPTMQQAAASVMDEALGVAH